MTTLRDILIKNCDFWLDAKLECLDERMLELLAEDMVAIKAVLSNPTIGNDPPGTHPEIHDGQRN